MTAPKTPRAALRALFDTAVATADPMRMIPGALPPKPAGRVVVIGAGKASARMAEAAEAAWGPCEGLVITRYGYARPCEGIRIVEAAHPVPDAAGAEATADLLALLETCGAEDFVLALISGGASSLLVAPAGDISLAEKQAVNAALLASGAPIDQMNTLRKHLSRVKGGQLAAAAYPAQMLSLMISDVPGDDPAYIGSGPTVGDNSTAAQAQAILEAWQIEAAPSIMEALAAPSGVIPAGDTRLAHVDNRIVAAPSQSLAAAAAQAQELGYDTGSLGQDLEGEAREVAADHAARALALAEAMSPEDAPMMLISGGELTVTRRGSGSGGPNAEYCLALAMALHGHSRIYAIAGDTDGVDGAAEVAGAIVTPDTLARCGMDAAKALAENDAHSYFAAAGDQVVTGPTLTNVNDFRAILILPPD